MSENKLLQPEARDFVAKVVRECQEGSPADLGPFYGAVAFALGRFLLQRSSVSQVTEADERRTDALFRAAMNQVRVMLAATFLSCSERFRGPSRYCSLAAVHQR